MSRLLLFFLLAALAVVFPGRAQTVTAGPDSALVNGPTPTRKQLSAADSAQRTERLFGLHVTRPTKAAVLATLPGAGQLYNRRWWKVPLVYGLLGGLGAAEYFYQIRFREYADAYNYLQTHPIPAGGRPSDVLSDPVKYPDAPKAPRASLATSVASVYTGVEFYRRNRDLYILYLTAGYGLQILDALVDAHLRDFDVSDDLSVRWDPALLPVPGQPLPGVGITVALRMK
jgi:hypothetical protein